MKSSAQLLSFGLFVFAFGLFGSPQTAEGVIVRFQTALGRYSVRLHPELMPNTVANFLSYVDTDRYDGTFIHRSARTQTNAPFVIQGGGFVFDAPNNAAPSIPLNAPIDDEPGGGVAGPSNVRGTIAMAKSGPDTVTSQWFINLMDNSDLDDPSRSDGGFAAFGRVLNSPLLGGDGMDVVDAIATLERQNFGGAFNTTPVLQTTGDVIDRLVFTTTVTQLGYADGDYNFDSVVDAADYTVWRNTLGSTTQAEADGNGNGIVDEADYFVWRSTFGQGGGPGAASASLTVPEPTSLLLAALASLPLLRGRRHRPVVVS